MAPQGFTEAAFNSVKPTVPGGMLVIDLGYLHKAWQFSGSDYKDPYRKDAQVNELLVLPGSWDGSELGTRVSFWLSAVTSPYTTFLGNNPLIWQKIKGDGLISLTVPKTRISQRILAPGEKFTFMDNTKLLGLSASMAYEANFSPYETKIKKGGPFFPTTVHGPGVLLEMQ